MEPISKYLEDVAKTQVEYLKQPEERDVMEEKRNLFIALSKKKERINKKISVLKKEIIEEEKTKNPNAKGFLVFGASGEWVEFSKSNNYEKWKDGAKELLRDTLINRYMDLHECSKKEAAKIEDQIWKKDIMSTCNGGWYASEVKP